MRISALLFVLIVSACTGPPAGTHLASDTQDQFALLRRASGCEVWRHLGLLRSRGVYSADGLRYDFWQLLDARTGRYSRRWYSSFAAMGGGEGFDGVSTWTIDRSRAWHRLDGPHSRELAVSNAWLNARAWCAINFGGARIQPLGDRAAGKHISAAFLVTPRGGAAVELWIDRSTHLIDRTIETLAEDHQVVSFRRWSAVRGAMVPFDLQVRFPEEDSTERWVVNGVTARMSAAPSMFRPPPQPNDVRGGDAASSIPLWIESDKPIIGVTIDGHAEFPYVADTGGHFIVTSSTAPHLGLRAIGSAANTGAGTAITQAGFAHVERLQIGNALLLNQVAKVMPFDFRRLERGARPPRAGWLGLELFERFAVTFDPERQRLTLWPFGASSRPQGSRIPIFFEEDAPLIACRIDGRPGECMIDTGNAGNTIVEGKWARRAGLNSSVSRSITFADGFRVTRATVSFGSITLPREIVELAPPEPRGSEAANVVAAILSEDILRRYILTLDYAAHGMWLQPIPNATARPYDRAGLAVRKERDGSFIIASLTPGSPASAAPLHAGDRIVKVDGEPAAELSTAHFYDVNRSAVGSTHTYEIDSPNKARHVVALRLRELLP